MWQRAYRPLPGALLSHDILGQDGELPVEPRRIGTWIGGLLMC